MCLRETEYTLELDVTLVFCVLYIKNKITSKKENKAKTDKTALKQIRWPCRHPVLSQMKIILFPLTTINRHISLAGNTWLL